MRLRKFLPFVLLTGVLLVTACAPVTPVIPQTGPDVQETATADPSTTVMPGDDSQGGTGGTGTGTGTGGTGTGTGGTGSQGGNLGNSGGTGGNTAPSPSGGLNDLSQGLRDSISGFVTEQSGAGTGEVEVVFAQQIDFQDGCLGIANQGESCTQVVTPGWQVVARSNGNLYVIHTDSSGNNVRLNQNADPNAIIGSGAGGNQGGTGTGTGGNTGNSGSNQGGVVVSLDQVIAIASQFLGQTLNVPVNQVAFTGVTVETWSDSCLGVGQANESCAQVATPGYRVTFNVSGQTYELRTDTTGANIRLVQGVEQ